MLKVDIISHNIPGSGFKKSRNLSKSDFIVYENGERFRVYFLIYTFKNICHILNIPFVENLDNTILKMIYGPRHRLLHIETPHLSILDFLKLVISKKD